MAILLRAIEFLCELKKYLNNLVHFFDAVNNLVSITLRETADQFIQIVKDATALEYGPGKEVQRVGSVSLDAWARQVCVCTSCERDLELIGLSGNIQSRSLCGKD